MSIYRCIECENYKDADYDGCNEHPSDECECMCDDCADRYESNVLNEDN